jgi:hypothetical protein
VNGLRGQVDFYRQTEAAAKSSENSDIFGFALITAFG